MTGPNKTLSEREADARFLGVRIRETEREIQRLREAMRAAAVSFERLCIQLKQLKKQDD